MDSGLMAEQLNAEHDTQGGVKVGVELAANITICTGYKVPIVNVSFLMGRVSTLRPAS